MCARDARTDVRTDVRSDVRSDVSIEARMDSFTAVLTTLSHSSTTYVKVFLLLIRKNNPSS